MPLKRLLLIPTGALLIAIALKLTAPAITDFAVTDLPSLYDGLVSWFRPPYLYIVINCIIATIYACSKLQSTKDEESRRPKPLVGALGGAAALPQPLEVAMPVAGKSVSMDYPDANFKYNDAASCSPDANGVSLETESAYESYEKLIDEPVSPRSETAPFHLNVGEGGDASGNKENEFVFSKTTWKAHGSTEMTEYASPNVKPLLTARFGHRKNSKSSPEGGKMLLGVSRPRRQDTLEATWKTITEGRAMPLTRHLKKFDTWERHGAHTDTTTSTSSSSPQFQQREKTMNKSETFNDHVKAHKASPSFGDSSGRLRRESSLTQDELNKRVEAFIRKFNEEMLLQRQESLNQHLEMVKR